MTSLRGSPDEYRDDEAISLHIMIKLENVSKHYGAKVAVNNLNLAIPQGKLFAFIGPNGAGKTTTVRMLTGLLQPTSGAITIGGHNIQKEPEAVKKLLAYVPDQPFLYDKLSGREFLRFVAEMYRISNPHFNEHINKYSAAVEAGRLQPTIGSSNFTPCRYDVALPLKLPEYVETFQMSEYLDQLIETYSLGMKQRVIITAALMHNPEVLVVDEPLVGLDPISTRAVKQLFRAMVDGGKTIFMSTHLLSVAEEIADIVGVMHQGCLIACGTLAELKARHKMLVPRAGSEGTDNLEDIFLSISEGQTK
ncbi:MAG: ABC transporter ATP-binding protein [Planctomycetes bacterium]|nr:ABC transporter ATP-binding protein [Planctomycetota bacterium]